MGGYRSGRHTSRTCTDQLMKLDVRLLAKQGVLKKGVKAQLEWERLGGATRIETRSKGNLVALRTLYWAGESVTQEAYQVPLESTPCHLGGSRLWFRCPNTLCDRRVAILYGGKTFSCRHCWNANYRCQRETSNDRLFRKIYKLRTKMGWTGGCGDGPGNRPKHMSLKRYALVCAAHNHMDQELDSRAEELLHKHGR